MTQPQDRASIDARLAHLFGAAVDWRRATGVVHVAALDARTRAVLAVGPGAPASATDRFVLGFARARADAIVTTGAILRAEPGLIHRMADDPEEERAWRAWRREVLGRSEPPCVLVLSASGRIPSGHPALRGPGRRILWTRSADASRGRGPALEIRIDAVAARPDAAAEAEAGAEAGAAASLSRAIAWLRGECGAETIAIEAGPAATLGLYRDAEGAGRARIDELLLALFAGDGAPRVVGESFPSARQLAVHFGGPPGQPRSRVRVEEPSGPWLFERYRSAGPDRL